MYCDRMAQILDSFPERDRPDGRVKYPWALWLDGTPRKLTRGVDFDCSPMSFYRQLRAIAHKRGIGVRTLFFADGDSIALEAVAKRGQE
jgi:hypothetical protein